MYRDYLEKINLDPYFTPCNQEKTPKGSELLGVKSGTIKVLEENNTGEFSVIKSERVGWGGWEGGRRKREEIWGYMYMYN